MANKIDFDDPKAQFRWSGAYVASDQEVREWAQACADEVQRQIDEGKTGCLWYSIGSADRVVLAEYFTELGSDVIEVRVMKPIVDYWVVKK